MTWRGKNIWNPTVPETLRERMHQINIVRRRRIAILTGEADAELAAAVRATADAAASNIARLAEAEELDEFSPDDTEDDAVWTVTLLPGCGFATYMVHPALRAQAPRFRPPTLPPRSKSPPRPDHCSPLEMVLRTRESVFLRCFPDIVTNALFEELGMPPYPHYIARLLPANFLIPPLEQGSAASASVQPVSIEPISAEPTPAHVPQPEESTVEIIEWDNLTKPIGFLCSASEPVEAHPASPFTTIGPLAMLQQIVASHPAPTMKKMSSVQLRRMD